jgi:hypothetical protein
MKALAAIRKFVNEGTNEQTKVRMKELKEFREACTADEIQAFGKQACEIMGETFEPV